MSAPPSSAYRVLVIDDESGLRDLLKFDLTYRGFFVDAAADGPEGLARLEQASFDVIVCDIMMPGCNGLELIDGLQQRCPGAKIIMTTGYPTDASSNESIRRGAFDYIAKPYDLNDLYKLILKACAPGSVPASDR